MKRFVYIFSFILILTSFACTVDKQELDPQLVGSWSDGALRYHFREDFSNGIKFLRVGSGADSVTTDSIAGVFLNTNSTKTLSFIHRVVFKRNGTIIEKEYKGSTWNYEIKNDSLFYESSTTIGRLGRVN